MIKAARVQSRADLQALERFRVDFHLLDAHTEGLRGGSGRSWDWDLSPHRRSKVPAILSGGLTADNVAGGIAAVKPVRGRRRVGHRGRAGDQGPGEDAGVHGGGPAPRRDAAGARVVSAVVEHRFGPYGGQYVPETLMPALAELEAAWVAARADPAYQEELGALLRDFVGRPTPLYHAQRLSEAAGHPVYLKREDLTHTGAHKINNAIGQCLLARRMGKTRIIAETGAGQHGVATATACALFGVECVVYMGTEDMRRQKPNVDRMRLMGATVEPVDAGARTLKEAVSAAIRDWVANVADTHYVIGSAVGPAPFPALVRDLQRVIGDEARAQILEQLGRLPDRVVACVGGGSNAIGIFVPFVGDAGVAARRRRGGGRRDRDRPPRRAADARRPRRRAARRLLGDHAGRGRADPRGALDLGRARLPRRRPGARAPARHGPRPLRRGHRRRGARGVPARRPAGGDRPRARVLARGRLGARPGRARATEGFIDLVCLSGRGDKDLAEALSAIGGGVTARRGHGHRRRADRRRLRGRRAGAPR